ncbi:MAG: hypothetical protein ACKVQA_25780 [Burkholderiales bacterium]
MRTDHTPPSDVTQHAEWLPITLWPHPWPTPGAWRALIFASKRRHTSRGEIPGNGLIEAGVLRRVGRRVLVNPKAFARWIEAEGARQVDIGANVDEGLDTRCLIDSAA